MGNGPTGDFESIFKQNYNFVQVLDDVNFGVVKIYRKRQINFDYVMVYDQSLAGTPISQRNKKLEELAYVKDNPHDQVLRLFHFQEIQKTTFECKVDVIRMYIEYYNFTLENLVENNARGKIFLQYDQILYIINSIISVYLYFDEIKANWFRIQPSQIFISTNGCVYFSPTQICRSFGDEVTGCLIKTNPHRKPDTLQPTNAHKSYQKLKQLMYNLIQHHSLMSFQQFQRLQVVFDSASTIKGIAAKMPKTTRTEIDMQKQIYRSEDSSSSNSNKRADMSNSTTNRSFTFSDERGYKRY